VNAEGRRVPIAFHAAISMGQSTSLWKWKLEAESLYISNVIGVTAAKMTKP